MRRLIYVLLAVAVGFVISRWLVVNRNPEYAFWRACMDQKVEELETLREKKSESSVVLFSGGSTCAFSIAPDVFERNTGIPSYNVGGAAPMGAPYLCSKTFEMAKKGDTVVLLLEPVFLTARGQENTKRLGVSLSASEEESEYKEIFGADVALKDEVIHLRPGSSFFFMTLGKKLLNKDAYRYSMKDFRSGGRLETIYQSRWKKPQATIHQIKLNESGKTLLRNCVKAAKLKGCRIVYSLPWTWTQENVAGESRKINELFLQQVEHYIQVLREPHMGVTTNGDYFADTNNHLTTQGATERTKELASAVMHFLSSQR